METKEIIKVLEHYQAWRTDENVPPKITMPHPNEIGIALNNAIYQLKYVARNEFSQKEIEAIKADVNHILNYVDLTEEARNTRLTLLTKLK